MKSQLIAQGAEAKIFLKDNLIIKDRISKKYRIPELDKKIRKTRTKAETKLLIKAGNIINVPKVFESKKENQLKIEFIKGKKLSENLDNFSLTKQKKILKQIGESVAKLHKANIIHGDLTTSNMILKEKKNRMTSSEAKKDAIFKYEKGGFDKGKLGSLYFIDFGLGFQNGKYEDKAVDIHLLKQALEAKHFKNWEILYKEFEKAYKKENKLEAEKVLTQLTKVEKRGRYKN